MQVNTSITGTPLADVARVAAELEARGYDGVSTQENRYEPFLPLAAAAIGTSQLRLRTSIAIAFARSPMAVAQVAFDIQRAAAGRFTLGLGSQVKGHNVRRFSVPWSAPAPRLREYVQALRAIWRCWQDGERLDYQGEHYQFSLMTPNFTPEPLPTAPPRIQIAAVGPAMMNVAATECDGVQLHTFCTPRYLTDAILPRLQRGLDRVGKSRSAFEISGGGFIATGPDDAAVERMREWVRTRVGFYGSTPSYWPVFEAHDLLDLGHKLNDMSKKGQWDAMTREVDDEVLDLFCTAGRFDEIAGHIETRFGGLIDVISAADCPKDLLQDLRRIDSPCPAPE